MSFPDEQKGPDSGVPPYASNDEGQSEALSEGQLREALSAAEAKAQDSQNMYMRALAEMENVRKRATRDIEQAHKYALERFAGELIGVKDSLELGLAVDTGDATTIRNGAEATLKLLSKAFEKAGLQEVVPQDQPFNPEVHEAMVAQPSADKPANTVLQVVQKGYLLNGRLLRPARVIVSREP
jgi:molecular chaperone GrpE